MNVTFHVLGSIATAAILSSRLKKDEGRTGFFPNGTSVLIAGFVSGVLLHGFLDYMPHAYPIRSAWDVLLGLALFFLALSFAYRSNWILLCTCFTGSLFPDLVDLGPAVANKYLGLSLPELKIFPWHWPEHSGSIYDGSRAAESLLCHLALVGLSLGAILAFRRWLFRGLRQ